MPARTSPEATEVADALHSAAIHLLRRLRREDERAGISAAKLSALSVLVFRGPLRPTDLALAEQVKAPTMTKLVAAMEREGLVRRRPDPRDARAVRLEATARGTRILQEGRRRRIQLLADALQRVSHDERESLAVAAALIETISQQL
jgi:DNA-binding MarR family transcriptional regulator